MYVIALLPLIARLRDLVKQHQCADDPAAGGKLEKLKSWWEALKEFRPEYGYFSNAFKIKLIGKREHLVFAERVFSGSGSGIKFLTERHNYLECPIGS